MVRVRVSLAVAAPLERVAQREVELDLLGVVRV